MHINFLLCHFGECQLVVIEDGSLKEQRMCQILNISYRLQSRTIFRFIGLIY